MPGLAVEHEPDGGRDRLEIAFVDDRFELRPGDTLTFGRIADIVLDEANRYLHRVCGRFVFLEGVWWLQNVGSSLTHDLLDHSGGRALRLLPGDHLPLWMDSFAVRLRAGRAEYQLDGRGTDPADPSLRALPPLPDGTTTMGTDRLPLSGDQLHLLLALAEPRLRGDPTAAVPPNKQIAHRLGMRSTQYNRKLDHLCERLAARGVRGIKGDLGGRADDRRQALVEWALSSRTVTADDLPLLDARPAVADPLADLEG